MMNSGTKGEVFSFIFLIPEKKKENMKQIIKKMLVLTDGTWYYENTSRNYSHFTNDVRRAWNFYSEKFPSQNTKPDLQWQLDTWTNDEPYVKAPDRYNTHIWKRIDVKIDRKKFKLKWVIITETIEEKEFNYENFSEKRAWE